MSGWIIAKQVTAFGALILALVVCFAIFAPLMQTAASLFLAIPAVLMAAFAHGLLLLASNRKPWVFVALVINCLFICLYGTMLAHTYAASS